MNKRKKKKFKEKKKVEIEKLGESYCGKNKKFEGEACRTATI